MKKTMSTYLYPLSPLSICQCLYILGNLGLFCVGTRFATVCEYPVAKFQYFNDNDDSNTRPEIQSPSQLWEERWKGKLRSGCVLHHQLLVYIQLYTKKILRYDFLVSLFLFWSSWVDTLITKETVVRFIRTAWYVFLIKVVMVGTCWPWRIGHL